MKISVLKLPREEYFSEWSFLHKTAFSPVVANAASVCNLLVTTSQLLAFLSSRGVLA